ncbi:unnamed protein product [Paramecium octaurelia]|uniref:Transmembrane protein n=1 Tax=Paramecium octaurelia TaxID=43137 RepID=A0A8S1V9H6_PAROT|nr:unnamed protein product [Paramecium octaurelia]
MDFQKLSTFRHPVQFKQLTQHLLQQVMLYSYIIFFNICKIYIKPSYLLNCSQVLSQFNGLQTKAFFKRNFNLFQELKKVVFTSCIILLDYQQNLSITILVITQIITVTLLATKLPFKARIINFIVLWSEILMTLCLTLMAAIIFLDYISLTYLEEKTRNILGWSIISLFVGSIFIRSAGCLIELILNIQKL